MVVTVSYKGDLDTRLDETIRSALESVGMKWFGQGRDVTTPDGERDITFDYNPPAEENYGMAGHISQHTQPAIAELLDHYYDELYKDGTGHSKVREFIEHVRQQQAST